MILKGVETKLIGGRTFFKVESLNEHFDGLLIHESDWVQVEDEAYVVLSDVNFDNATDNEIQRDSEVAKEVNEGMTFEEAEKELNAGYLVALPEWEGFWFKNLNVENVQEGEILVLTKDGEVLNTPWEESKERNDWIIVKANPEQEVLLEDYFASLEVSDNKIEVVEPEVVEPEIVAPEVIVAETPTEEIKAE